MYFLHGGLKKITEYAVFLRNVFLRAYKQRPKRTLFVTVALVFFVYVSGLLFIPPFSFPTEKIVSIPKGASLQETAYSFKENNVIRSSFWFSTLVRLMGGEHSLSAGDYFFDRLRSTPRIAYMVTFGDYGLVPLRVRLQEGDSRTDMATRLSEKFDGFNVDTFLTITNGKEGYLFPDTYYFFPNVSEKEVAESLEDTFYEKIEPYQDAIKDSEHSLEDIIIMASLIEREAHTPESRRIISGILWNRISIGMLLQVDVTFDYINGKSTFELTQKDLELDSKYNTYKYAGLPPGPISNPSIDSIEAAIFPTKSDYLYFLADSVGETHYSMTFEEHKDKKLRYHVNI